MKIEIEIETRRSMIETALRDMIPGEDVRPASIHQAMRYAVLNGGKRLRPILALEGARLAGGEMERVLPFACAVELIHSYSLVHDDLPAMDDDDFRRGNPTCHKVFGEALAILAGDALLTRAFELPLMMMREPGIRCEDLMRAWNELACAVGSQGMIAGQVIDLESEGKWIDAETLRYMHRNKTGALFVASLKGGAMIFGASDRQLQALQRYAEHFGLAFQITDDILDVEGDEMLTGKPVGSDERSHKATFVSIFGLAEAKLMAAESVEQAVDSLGIFGKEGEFLRALAKSILERRQ